MKYDFDDIEIRNPHIILNIFGLIIGVAIIYYFIQ
mgnify:CR=1 FL=1